MVFVLGASSLFYVIQAQPRKLRDTLQGSCLAIKRTFFKLYCKKSKEAISIENAILEDMKEKSSSLDLTEKSLAEVKGQKAG